MIVEILLHTPIWVYGLFIGLTLLGWQQSRSRLVKQPVLFILPAGMLLLSFFGVTSSFGYSFAVMLYWVFGASVCTLSGLKLFPSSSAKYQQATGSFHVPGSWWPSVFIMAIFFTKYAVGVVSSIHPEVFNNLNLVLGLAGLYGVLTGTFFTRAIRVLKVKYRSEESMAIDH
ncbi:DUF6622 family protein [Bowmanella sp. JS7-9]|uniref:DUF6622 family protein n=1 Tax=Pseudobowmanella zhangzhouensis TaxID=1537679 RepID=A0ABW1XIX0_9ALTE|nr:DUF6622 family protein [Bowmanella sp. JS7-9]